MEARDETRAALLAAVEAIREVVVAGADESESRGTLADGSVRALRGSGLLRMKLPSVLGGHEADPVTQMEVIEALTRIDATAGWCMMIGATTAALPGAFLCDAAAREIFAGEPGPTFAGVAMPRGEAIPVDGGYRVTGTWPFASGIRHAEWVSGGCRSATPEGTPTLIMAIVPTARVKLHDDWQVAGLRGTGSCSFTLEDLFVPEAFTFNARAPERGGALYRMGQPGFVANEHAAFALGVARRALDELLALAESKRRGLSPSALATRPTFQRDLGRAELALAAARALAFDVFERAWATARAGETPDAAAQAEMRCAAVYATEVSAEVVELAYRFAGGEALYLTSPLQACLRDIHAATQHFVVSEKAYEAHGQAVLGLPDPNPMA